MLNVFNYTEFIPYPIIEYDAPVWAVLPGVRCVDCWSSGVIKKATTLVTFLVIRMRLERMTVCLEGRCSIQLSYRTIFHAAYVVRLRFASAKLIFFFEVSKPKWKIFKKRVKW